MKTLNINWLGSCDNCGCTDLLVNTEKGNENFLYEDDEITCTECDLKGIVQIDDIGEDDDVGVAFASWNEE